MNEGPTNTKDLVFGKFIDQLIEEKNLPGVDDAVRQVLREDLHDRLLDFVDRALVEAMPDEAVTKLNDLVDSEAPEEDVQAYVASSVDTEQVTTLALIRFKNLYLDAEKPRVSADEAQ